MILIFVHLLEVQRVYRLAFRIFGTDVDVSGRGGVTQPAEGYAVGVASIEGLGPLIPGTLHRHGDRDGVS